MPFEKESFFGKIFLEEKLPKMYAESFGTYIRDLRKKSGQSLRIVGSEVDIDQSTLSKIERNELLAPSYIVKPLARLFQVNYQELQTRHLSEKIYRDVKDYEHAREALELASTRLELEDRRSANDNERQHLIEKIKAYLRDSPIEKAWLFGSFVRAQEKFDSDIDLLIRLRKSAKIDLLDYIGIVYDLEDLLGRSVDLVQEGTLAKHVEDEVDKEKVLIYGQ